MSDINEAYYIVFEPAGPAIPPLFELDAVVSAARELQREGYTIKAIRRGSETVVGAALIDLLGPEDSPPHNFAR